MWFCVDYFFWILLILCVKASVCGTVESNARLNHAERYEFITKQFMLLTYCLKYVTKWLDLVFFVVAVVIQLGCLFERFTRCMIVEEQCNDAFIRVNVEIENDGRSSGCCCSGCCRCSLSHELEPNLID